MLLALTSLARAASSATSAKLSARLTATELVASQVKSVKLVYKLPASSKSFTYSLSYQRGSIWQPVNSAAKTGNFTSAKSMALGKLFGSKLVKVGSYRAADLLRRRERVAQLSNRSLLGLADQEELHDRRGEVDQADLRLLEAEQELRLPPLRQEGLGPEADQ